MDPLVVPKSAIHLLQRGAVKLDGLLANSLVLMAGADPGQTKGKQSWSQCGIIQVQLVHHGDPVSVIYAEARIGHDASVGRKIKIPEKAHRLCLERSSIEFIGQKSQWRGVRPSGYHSSSASSSDGLVRDESPLPSVAFAKQACFDAVPTGGPLEITLPRCQGSVHKMTDLCLLYAFLPLPAGLAAFRASWYSDHGRKGLSCALDLLARKTSSTPTFTTDVRYVVCGVKLQAARSTMADVGFNDISGFSIPIIRTLSVKDMF